MITAIRNLFLSSGWEKALYGFGAALVLYVLDFEFLSSLVALATFFVLYIYRVPKKMNVSMAQSGMVAPVDGKVVQIDEKEDHYLVEIESGFFNHGVLRAPCDVVVKEAKLVRGTRLSKERLLFSKLNETLVITFDVGENEVELTHRMKQGCFPAELHVDTAQKLSTATTYGFIHNAVTYIKLPKNFRFNVDTNASLKGAQTILGYFS